MGRVPLTKTRKSPSTALHLESSNDLGAANTWSDADAVFTSTVGGNYDIDINEPLGVLRKFYRVRFLPVVLSN